MSLEPVRPTPLPTAVPTPTPTPAPTTGTTVGGWLADRLGLADLRNAFVAGTVPGGAIWPTEPGRLTASPWGMMQ